MCRIIRVKEQQSHGTYDPEGREVIIKHLERVVRDIEDLLKEIRQDPMKAQLQMKRIDQLNCLREDIEALRKGKKEAE